MKDGAGTLLTLALQFSLLSFLAIGGAITALPEMHRQAVDVYHWMTSTQFTQLVAIAQAAPGPNVLIVTLIGQQVAGIPGRAGGDGLYVRPGLRGRVPDRARVPPVQAIALGDSVAGRPHSSVGRSRGRDRVDRGALG
jgi:Chromate transport protein ChrA